jgi:hypothetical protein
MRQNIIEESDSTDHHQFIISSQILEILWHDIINNHVLNFHLVNFNKMGTNICDMILYSINIFKFLI